MALFLRQDDSKSELQKRVAAELQEKIRADGRPLEYEKPESSLLDNTHTSSENTGVMLTLVAMVGVVGLLVFFMSR